MPSITSEESLPSVPIEWIPIAKVPVNAPRPVIGKNTNAKINSGNALIIFRICFIIWLEWNVLIFFDIKDLNLIDREVLFADKKAIGKLNIAPMTVPVQAIYNDSNTLGIPA